MGIILYCIMFSAFIFEFGAILKPFQIKRFFNYPSLLVMQYLKVISNHEGTHRMSSTYPGTIYASVSYPMWASFQHLALEFSLLKLAWECPTYSTASVMCIYFLSMPNIPCSLVTVDPMAILNLFFDLQIIIKQWKKTETKKGKTNENYY